VPAVELAAELVARGEIGRVVQTTGLGPHRLNRAIRPPWFFDPLAYGGILVDIASHQIDQFLFFTGTTDARVVSSSVGNFALPEVPAFEDYGELLLHGDAGATGFIRVDWLTPAGLPTWGDGRLVLLGSEGFIELRKYVDIAGRPGTDHVFLCNRAGTRHIDASGAPLRYFERFLADVRDRTQTAMRQAHPFIVSRLAIEAQQRAKRLGALT
jgi:predicted dehydrogenase